MVAILYFVFMYICTGCLWQCIGAQCIGCCFVVEILINYLVLFRWKIVQKHPRFIWAILVVVCSFCVVYSRV